MLLNSDVAGRCRAMELLHGENGCKVQWLPEGDNQPRTDMVTKTVYLPRPRSNWGHHEWMIWSGEGHHEHGHHDESQEALVKMMRDQKINYQSKLGLCINVIDDIWQEMVASRKYPGVAQTLSYMQADCCRRGAESIKQESGQFDRFIVDALGLAYDQRRSWQPDVLKAYPDYAPMSEHQTKWGHLVPQITAIIDQPTYEASAAEVIRIAKEMLTENGDDPEAPENYKQDADQPGEQAGDGDSEAAQAAKGDGEGDAVAAKSAAISYEELMGHTHSDDGSKPSGEINIIYDHTPRDDYDPFVASEFITGYPTGDDGEYAVEDLQEAMDPYIPISHKLNRLFQTYSQTRTEFQHKRGRLVTKHLSRVPHGETRVFSRKVERIDNTADVMIMCDTSGSIWGCKYEAMVPAVTALTQALDRARVPNKVVGFTCRRSYSEGPQCYHHSITEWDEKPSVDKVLQRFADMPMCQNADSDSLLAAYRELCQRDSNRKILIVMSDGQPNSVKHGDAASHLRRVVSEIYQRGNVELYAIGILDDAVSKFYRDYAVLDSPDDIEPTLTELIKSKILRG